MKIALRIEGERACFRRPELRDDLVSYDTMTPLAADQILARLLDPRRWKVQLFAITVLHPIRFRWWEVAGPQAGSKRMHALMDVAYIIQASIHSRTDISAEPAVRGEVDKAKAENVFLGLRDCPASRVRVLSLDEQWQSSLTGTHDLGWMIYDLAAARGGGPRFFRAELRDGRMTIPSAEEIDFAY